MTDGERPRRMMVASVGHWEFVLISALFVAIYITRETGAVGGAALRVLDDVLIAAALALSLHAARVAARTAAIHLVLAGTAITIAIVEAVVISESLSQASSAISGYLVIATAVFVFAVVLRQQVVSPDTLFGALAVYLSVGVVFGMAFTAIARSDPAAFEPAQFVIDGESSLYFFSFVTLTTLGYGDIAPASDAVRILATLEAIIGVMMLAAVVGWIVGLLVAARTGAKTDRRLDELAATLDRIENGNAIERTASGGEAPAEEV